MTDPEKPPPSNLEKTAAFMGRTFTGGEVLKLAALGGIGSARVLQLAEQLEEEASRALPGAEQRPEPLFDELDREVFNLFTLGYTWPEISSLLKRKKPNTGERIPAIEATLGAKTPPHAVRRAYETGWFKPADDPDPELMEAAASLSADDKKHIKYISLGLADEEIANKFNCSERTVNRRTNLIKRKVEAQNRPHLVRLSIEAGIIDL